MKGLFHGGSVRSSERAPSLCEQAERATSMNEMNGPDHTCAPRKKRLSYLDG